MINRKQRQKEERVLLYQVFTEDATTDAERIIGIRNAQFVEKSLELLKIKTLLGIGKRGAAGREWYALLDRLMEEEIAERYNLGLIPPTIIHLDHIQSAMYDFHFKYIKAKTKAIATGKKIIHYRNSSTIRSQDEQSARYQLHQRLKKLGDTLIQELSVSKHLHSIITTDGDIHPINTIQIVK